MRSEARGWSDGSARRPPWPDGIDARADARWGIDAARRASRWTEHARRVPVDADPPVRAVRRVGPVVLGLALWPLITFVTASALPIRIARDRRDLGLLGQGLAWLVGPLFGTGAVSLLLTLWLWPAMDAVERLSRVGPHDPVGTGWAFVYLAVFLLTGVWSGLLGVLGEWLREGRPPGEVGPVFGAGMVLLTVLGGSLWLQWLQPG